MDYDDERCCCGYLPIARGAQVIGAIYAFAAFLTVWNVNSAFFTPIEKLWLAVEVVCLVLLFVGTSERHRNSRFVVPFGCMLAFSAIIGVIFYIVSCVSPDSKLVLLLETRPTMDNQLLGEGTHFGKVGKEIVTRIGGFTGFLAFALGLALEFWWIQVIYRCYKHIRMLELQAYDVIH